MNGRSILAVTSVMIKVWYTRPPNLATFVSMQNMRRISMIVRVRNPGRIEVLRSRDVIMCGQSRNVLERAIPMSACNHVDVYIPMRKFGSVDVIMGNNQHRWNHAVGIPMDVPMRRPDDIDVGIAVRRSLSHQKHLRDRACNRALSR